MQPIDATFWLLLTLLVIILALLVSFLAWNESKFLKQVRQIISESDAVAYVDIHNVSESWHIERERLLHLLRRLLGEALSGTDKQKAKADAIRKLLEEHNAKTPYSELPENISLQLIALSAAHPNARAQISQLAASLSELYSKNQREIKKQKKIAFWSLVVGIVGVLIAIVIPLRPLTASKSIGPGSRRVQDSAAPTPTP
jgi:hypothetical protein